MILIMLVILLTGCTILAGQAAVEPDIALYLTQAADFSGRQQYSAALDHLQRAARLGDGDARPWVEMGQIYLRQHRWPLAEEAFREALKRGANNQAATLGLAEALLEQGRAVEAILFWQRALERDGAQDGAQNEGWIGLGRAYLARNDYRAAREAFDKALVGPPHAEAQWYLAALTISTDFAAGHALLTQMAGLTGKRDHLLAALEPFTAQSPPAEIAKSSGIALIQLEEWALAHHALRVAVEQNPSDPQTWAFLGYAQGALGLPAIEAFNRARELAPELALIPYFEGIYLRRKERPDLAIDRFLKALDLDPNNLGVALETAQTLAEEGDYLSAEAWYRSLVEFEPESVVYQEFLTAFYVERSYRLAETGQTAAEKLVEMAPDSARAHDLLGWARFQTGDYPGAEAALRRAIALDPADVAPRYHLGRLLEAQHRNVEAQDEFTHVIDWDTSGIYRERVLGP